MPYIVEVDDKTFKIDLVKEGDKFKVLINDEPVEVDVTEVNSPSHLSLIVNNKSYDVVIEDENTILVNNEVFRVNAQDEHLVKILKSERRLVEKREVVIQAPMPGLVVNIECKEGDKVKRGQGLLTLEAMKMQNEIKAPKDCVVKKILVQKGASVNTGEKLVILE